MSLSHFLKLTVLVHPVLRRCACFVTSEFRRSQNPLNEPATAIGPHFSRANYFESSGKRKGNAEKPVSAKVTHPQSLSRKPRKIVQPTQQLITSPQSRLSSLTQYLPPTPSLHSPLTSHHKPKHTIFPPRPAKA
jgi:hypothetical protein